MMVKIRTGRGNIDHYIQLSPQILELPRSYLKVHRPVDWLREGSRGKYYIAENVVNVVKKVG
jgi:integrase/recombinase XerD